MTLKVRTFEKDDWPAVQQIYQQGIDTKNATFQEKAKTWEEWDATALQECRLVATDGEAVVGWAALSAVSSRRVYAGVAEVSVYVSNSHQGQGVGKQLLSALVTESENSGFWTLQAGIFPENAVSLALHKRCGFREVGTRERLGKMCGVWRDVVLLERRSPLAGI